MNPSELADRIEQHADALEAIAAQSYPDDMVAQDIYVKAGLRTLVHIAVGQLREITAGRAVVS